MTRTAGFTLVELLVSLTVFILVIAGASAFYINQSQMRLSEQLGVTMEGNLRLALDTITFSLRNTGYGAPTSSFATWMPWVTGFTANPLITAGGSATTPDTISIAACTSQPVAHLTAGAASGATTLTVDNAASLDNANKKLIYIGDNEQAVIQSISGNTLSIDTNPAVVGPQGVSKAYAISTPICRVDVVTFSVDTTAKKLMKDDNQGTGAQAIMDGVTNLKITSVTGGAYPKYQITLTAQSGQPDPTKLAFTSRSLSSTASTRQ